MYEDVAPHAWSPHDFPHSEEEAKARLKSSLATSSSPYGLSCEVCLTLLSSLVSDQLTTTAAASFGTDCHFAVHVSLMVASYLP